MKGNAPTKKISNLLFQDYSYYGMGVWVGDIRYDAYHHPEADRMPEYYTIEWWDTRKNRKEYDTLQELANAMQAICNLRKWFQLRD